jgi:hypothetical protein
MTGSSGGVGHAVQTTVNGGSELLIYVPRAAHSRDRDLAKNQHAQPGVIPGRGGAHK